MRPQIKYLELHFKTVDIGLALVRYVREQDDGLRDGLPAVFSAIDLRRYAHLTQFPDWMIYS